MHDFRGSATASASTTVSSLPPPSSTSFVLLAICLTTVTDSVTSIAGGTGTFTQMATKSSSNRKLELWIGYNFGTSKPTSLTITRSGSGTVYASVRVLDGLWDAGTAPSWTASSGYTGTATTGDFGSITPAVGDIVFGGLAWPAFSFPSSTASTGNNYLNTVTVSAGSGPGGVSSAHFESLNTTASNFTYTFGASLEMAGIQVKITPAAAPSPVDALLVKGLDTAAADAASSF